MYELALLRCVAGFERHAVAVAFDAFDRHDGIRAVGQDAPGHDLDAGARIVDRQRRSAGRLRPDQCKAVRPGLDRRIADRDAVHRDAIERRLIALGRDRFAQYPSLDLRDRESCARDGHHAGFDQRFRVRDVDAEISRPLSHARRPRGPAACESARGSTGRWIRGNRLRSPGRPGRSRVSSGRRRLPRVRKSGDSGVPPARAGR